jgi:RNA polymerase sigma factor (sigma-70 family)
LEVLKINSQETIIDLNNYTNLAHALVHKSKRLAYALNVEYEDLYQIAMIGIWKASMKFNESKGVKFTTFAYAFAHYDILKHFRVLQAKCRTATLVSLDNPLNGETLTTWHSIKPDQSADHAFEEADSVLDLQAILKTKNLSINEKNVINCILKTNEIVQKNISKHIGLSESQTWRVFGKLRVKLAN